MSLLVIVPTRSRPAQCERLIESFEKNTGNADLLFVTDGDDDSYKEFDFRGHVEVVQDPRGSLVQKLNHTADAVVNDYDQLMWVGDDHTFDSPNWDAEMLKTLRSLGGSGWVYPDDKRRKDVPEIWMVSSDIVKELGWFANPMLYHYYIDNVIADLGKRTDMLRWCPNAVVTHHHYAVDKTTVRDELYISTEEKYGQLDLVAYQAWRNGHLLGAEVSRLRKKFHPDVSWVLGRV